jgi:glycosyltransferase involved in cell wall biosynthesis
MDIAFIDVTCTQSFGGVQTAVWQLAIALADLGHRVTVYGGEGEIRPELGGRAITVRTFPARPRASFANFGTRYRKFAERWHYAGQARQAVAAAGHDWVVLTKPFDFFWPRLLPAGSATRFAFMSGGTDFFPGDRRLARRIAAMAACSHFNAWQVASRYGRWPAVMYNGVDVGAFAPGRRDPALRRRLGVGDDEVLFAFAGRVVGWKGLGIALDALARPELAALPLRLLIVGAGGDLDRLRRQAEALGVAGRVIFQPPVPHAELPAWYASADAGLFPSIADEAFGITIAEAMACGLPVVASHVGGIPEVVGNEGGCGLLAAPGDAAALAAAMRELATDPARRAVLGEAARRRIASEFTWQQSATRLLAALAAAR